MKNIYVLAFMFLVPALHAQDYFTIVVKNDSVTYNYPENSIIEVIGSTGKKSIVKKDEALTLKGDYKLSITVPWRTDPENITSDGGMLEIFVLPKSSSRAIIEKPWSRSEHYPEKKHTEKPSLTRKELTKSDTLQDAFNILVVFSNSLAVKYEDGVIRAWQNGDEIILENPFIIETSEGLLKFSFDSQNGEFWYVFNES